MRIGVPEIELAGTARYSVPVSTKGSGSPQRSLWFETDLRFHRLISRRADAALVSLLMPAMMTGEEIHVEGPVTDSLLYRLNSEVQDLLLSFMPELNRVVIRASQQVPPSEVGALCAMGFSAGVDSYAAFHDFGPAAPASLRVTHLTYTNVGSHGLGGRPLFLARHERLVPAAHRLGLPFVWIDSNLSDFYDPFPYLVYESTHVIRNAATAHLVAGGVGTWLHASTYRWSDITLQANSYMARIEPFLLPLLSTSHIALATTGSQHSRIDKTRIVATMPDTHEFLDVCVSPGAAGNCSACEKCLRTLLTLEMLGCLDLYENVFDPALYGAKRRGFIESVIASDLPFNVEIVEFASKIGYPLARSDHQIEPTGRDKAKTPITGHSVVPDSELSRLHSAETQLTCILKSRSFRWTATPRRLADWVRAAFRKGRLRAPLFVDD